MADVFISYRRKSSSDRAIRLKEELEKRGYEVFLDIEMGTGDFTNILTDELKKCRFVVVLVTEGGFDACWENNDIYRQEISVANEHKKIIIPVMDEGYKFPARLPKSIEFLRLRNGVVYHPNLLESTVTELQNKMLQHTLESTSIRKNRSMRPDSKYMHKSLEEMASTACNDARKSRVVYGLAHDAYNRDPDAFLELGKSYYFGENIKKDYDKAVFWFHQAVLMQKAPAMYYLGECYRRGKGVDKSSAQATYWYEQGAAQKKPSTQALCALGDFYLHGESVTLDPLQAAKYYLKAAREENIQTAETCEDVRGILSYMKLVLKSTQPKRFLLTEKGYTPDQLSTTRKDKAREIQRNEKRKKFARRCRSIGRVMGTVTALSVFCGGAENIILWEQPYLASLIFWILTPITLLSIHYTLSQPKRSTKDDLKRFVTAFLPLLALSCAGIVLLYKAGVWVGQDLLVRILTNLFEAMFVIAILLIILVCFVIALIFRLV